MASNVKLIKLNDGSTMPSLGLGLWKSKPEEVYRAVKDAIDIGYRHFDGACIYLNERHVGKAIADKIDDGTVKREELFITSKLWNNYHNPDLVERGCRSSLNDLGLDYLDLYLIHFPFGYQDGDELGPMDDDGNILFSDWDYVDTWKGMERLVELGLTKSVGVSNFNHKQLQRLIETAKIKPVTNQVECHPYLPQIKLSEWMKQHDVLLTGYSPLGSPDRPNIDKNHIHLLSDERLEPLCAKYKKTPAQLLIRYQLERGFAVVPKTVSKQRLAENFQVFDFQLANEDIDLMNGFDCNMRFLTVIGYGDKHKYYPFNEEF